MFFRAVFGDQAAGLVPSPAWGGRVCCSDGRVGGAGKASEWSNEGGGGAGGGSGAGGGEFRHATVLREEAVEALGAGEGKLIVDGTLGGGGHTEALLAAGARVVGFDRDGEAREAVRKRLGGGGESLIVLPYDFREMAMRLRELGVGQVDGILLDLGVSSPQLDEAWRGFSFQQDGPLDMRMDRSKGETAADLVNGLAEDELARIFRDYGEERHARRIARALVAARAEGERIERTGQLSELVARVMPGRRERGKHPATRVFQGLRIAVNDELGALEDALAASIGLLCPGGRLVVISFHSLEDRMVKRFIRERAAVEIDRREWPAPRANPRYSLREVNRKPVVASEGEVARNPRARSARMRVAERI